MDSVRTLSWVCNFQIPLTLSRNHVENHSRGKMEDVQVRFLLGYSRWSWRSTICAQERINVGRQCFFTVKHFKDFFQRFFWKMSEISSYREFHRFLVDRTSYKRVNYIQTFISPIKFSFHVYKQIRMNIYSLISSSSQLSFVTSLLL